MSGSARHACSAPAGEYTAERLKELQGNALRMPPTRPAAKPAPESIFKLSGSFKSAAAPKDDRFDASTAVVRMRAQAACCHEACNMVQLLTMFACTQSGLRFATSQIQQKLEGLDEEAAAAALPPPPKPASGPGGHASVQANLASTSAAAQADDDDDGALIPDADTIRWASPAASACTMLELLLSACTSACMRMHCQGG